jgi:hypothetical protein
MAVPARVVGNRAECGRGGGLLRRDRLDCELRTPAKARSNANRDRRG